MILLLGGSGYVGSAFVELFEKQGISYRNVSRREVDYTDLLTLRKLIYETQPTFLVNAAGYTGKPNVDACELDKSACLSGNAVLPGIIRTACEEVELPWGHVSSGCIYTGRRSDGRGFTEEDEPNFCFRTNNCSFYSGSKALGEECLQGADQTYIWRLRIPFNHVDSSRNYLSKLQRYARLLEAENSISHLNDFVWACWQTWEQRVPFGIYNVTNAGAVTTKQVVGYLKKILKLKKSFEYFGSVGEFMEMAAETPRSNCVMSSEKLAGVGIKLRRVEEAIEQSLKSWQPAMNDGAVAQSTSQQPAKIL